MNAWKEKIAKCHCWYPSLTVDVVNTLLQSDQENQEIVDAGNRLLENNMTHLFEKWKDSCTAHKCTLNTDNKIRAIGKIFNIVQKYGYTYEIHKDIQMHLNTIEPSAESLALEQQMVLTDVVEEHCTCKRPDPGLARAQGHPDTVHWEKYPEKWKPYTTSYPLQDIDDSGLILQLSPAMDIVDKYFHTAAQMNARMTWQEVGEQKYVDFANGTYETIIRETPKLYNKRFIDFNRSTYNHVVLCPNGFGEYFEFYDNDNNKYNPSLEYNPSLKYKSKTEVGDYVNIDKYSHTDQFRSDCSLWYRYYQERMKANILMHATAENWKHIVANTERKIKKIELTPPYTNEDRYKYWKYIKNTL